jgi:hypothetical protein
MSVSKKRLGDKKFCAEVVRRYRAKQTTTQIADELGCGWPTVRKVLEQELTAQEYDTLKRANYSRSKTGEKNSMYGAKTAAERILRQGRFEVWNGKGYTQEHRIIFAKALGFQTWPEGWEVHHIDGNKINNHPDNLALVTKKGHQRLHGQKLGRLYLWEKETYGTSVLQEIKAMLLKD